MTGSPSRSDPKEAPPEQAKEDTSSSTLQLSSSSTRRSPPPRLLLDGADVPVADDTEPLNEKVENAEDEEDAERLRELDRLRVQLQKSELNRSPHAPHHALDSARKNQQDDSHELSPEAPLTESPEVLKSSQRSRRRVQWVGLSADDEYSM